VLVGEHTFLVRPGTSDLKAIKEDIVRNNYQRCGVKIEDGEHWLDLGAYIGSFSVLALSLGANVTAFEPDPESFKMVTENVLMNALPKQGRTFEPYEAGVWTEPKEFTMSRNSQNGNLWRNSIIKKWNKGEEVNVKCEDYKKFLQDDICVKMDIEGAEMAILEDLPEDAKIKKMVVEWSFDIDNDIDRYRRVVEKLQRMFKKVTYKKIPEHEKVWKDSWFPPYALLYCVN